MRMRKSLRVPIWMTIPSWWHGRNVWIRLADMEIVVEPGNLVPSKFLALQQVFGFVTVLCHDFEFPAANSTDFQN